MKIERQYYTESRKWMEEIDDELRQMQESMTEEEKQAEKEERQREFKQLVERIEKEEARVRRVTDRRKQKHFRVLAKAGLALAEIIEADYKAESDGTCGKIYFRTGPMFLSVPDGPSGKDELVLLIRMADHMEVIPDGDTLEWNFSFEFDNIFSR